MSIINAKHFQDEAAAYEYVEARVWPHGPVCPHCKETKRLSKMGGESTRIGTYKCYACRKPFTVKIGTIFESSHVKMHLWLQAIYLMCASKKGISSNQLHRTLGVTLKTAWFMSHRIRLAMDQSAGVITPVGGKGKTVEADETVIAKSRKTRRVKGERPDVKILTLIEREGRQQSVFLDERTVRSALAVHLHPESRLVTDQAQHYKFIMPNKDQHEAVDHSKKEYVRGDVHTNTAEGFFSIFKRGLVGTYQHIESQHVDRYLAEFDFRMNNRAKLGINDEMRTEIAVKGISGKRLTYRAAD